MDVCAAGVWGDNHAGVGLWPGLAARWPVAGGADARTDSGQRDGPGVGAAAAHTDPLVAGGDGLLDRLAEPAAHQRRRRGAVRLAGVAVCRHASGGCLLRCMHVICIYFQLAYQSFINFDYTAYN